jgi:hypothetical protein
VTGRKKHFECRSSVRMSSLGITTMVEFWMGFFNSFHWSVTLTGIGLNFSAHKIQKDSFDVYINRPELLVHWRLLTQGDSITQDFSRGRKPGRA